MNTYDVAETLRLYTDEPDRSFLTDAHLADSLCRAYDKFRHIVTDIVPYFYATTRDITIPAATLGYHVYDLTQGGASPTVAGSPSLLGPRPNAVGTPVARLSKLLSVESLASLGAAPGWRVPSTVDQDTWDQRNFAYILRGRELWIKGTLSFARLHYVPEQEIGISATPPVATYPTWRNVISSISAIEIDDLNQFHDVIALIAYDEYAIRDGAVNPMVIKLRDERIRELKEYLLTRDYEGNRYVHDVQEDW